MIDKREPNIDPSTDPAGPEKLGEERGLPPVNARKTGGKVGRILGVAALAVVVGAMLWISMKPAPQVAEEKQAVSETRRTLPPLELPGDDTASPPAPVDLAMTDAPPPPPAQVGASTTGQPQRHEPTPQELADQRRRTTPLIAFGGGGSTNAANAGADATAAVEGEGPDPNSLTASLQATATPSVNAQVLADRNYLLTKGTFLDCALITALDSTVPGLTSCRLTRNVYSDNGRVLLLERGSIIEGEYRGGQMRQGMKRIFVLWTRVRTPKGVVASLDSPGTDELGRSGLSGWVDTHFWKRYGGALMLSLVDDTAEYFIERQREGNEDSIQFDGVGTATQNAAAIALQNSINIPPTLHKNQGDLINVYVARDINFKSVYALRTAN